MIARKEIRRVLTGVSDYEPPVLTLYMNANPAAPDHSPKALAARAKSTLDGLQVAPAIAASVVDRLAAGNPKGRTLLVFANESRVDLLFLSVDLPLADTTSGRVESRFGRPYVTPLLIALDEDEHYGVIQVSRDHVRLFELSFGGVEKLFTATRARPPSETNAEPDARRTGVPYLAVRGDARGQLAGEHVRELSRLFYIATARQLRSRLDERELTRVILVGPREDTRRLERELPAAVASRIVLQLPSLPYQGATEAEVARRLSEPLSRLRDQREERLLTRAAERGVAGLDQSIYALQEGRLSALIVPWPLDVRLYRDRKTGYYFPRETGPNLEPTPLADALPDLASAFSTEIEFVLGANRPRLCQELGCLCGLTRW